MATRTVGPVPGPDKTYTAGGACTRGYAAIKGATDDAALQATVAGSRCIGVFAQDAVQGKPVRVSRRDDQVAIAGAAIALGDYVKVDATGRFITITGTPGEEIIGRAESTATAAGDEFVLFILPSVR